MAVYDSIGKTYAAHRRPDARIEAAIRRALGDARTVASVGSGAGSYEPRDLRIVGAEPSLTMIAQRPPGAAAVVQAVAERLPFAAASFDAALAVLTVHHWTDAPGGLAEMRRVAPRQVVVTWDPAAFARFWLVAEYLPEFAEREAGLATLDAVVSGLGGGDVRPLPVPWDCTDGFAAAYWRRPELYLDPDARAAISGLALLDQATVAGAMQRLEADLASGAWRKRHADLLEAEELDVGYRLVIAG